MSKKIRSLDEVNKDIGSLGLVWNGSAETVENTWGTGVYAIRVENTVLTISVIDEEGLSLTSSCTGAFKNSAVNYAYAVIYSYTANVFSGLLVYSDNTAPINKNIVSIHKLSA